MTGGGIASIEFKFIGATEGTAPLKYTNIWQKKKKRLLETSACVEYSCNGVRLLRAFVNI